MIRAEELMIGDWVIDGTRDTQVTGITCDGIIETTANANSNIELLEPITITPEILERNGFKLKEESESYTEYVSGGEHSIIAFVSYKESIYDVDTVLDCELGFVGGLNRIHHCHVKYVHELQHALRLCGINKIIEL